MFHETQVPRWPWRFAVMRTWQNWFFKQICLLADWTFVSTERWLPEVASVDPRAKAMVLPVGSNIPVSRLERVAARTKLDLPGDAFIAGIFGSAHTSRRLDWVAAAAQQYQAQRKALLVLHVGPDGDAVASELAGVPFKTQGPLPAEEVADALRAMDCLVTPFTDGVSTRRGSVMAALLNGVPVATTIRAWTDAVFKRADPRTLLLSSAMNSESFANDATRWMRELEPQTGDLAQSFAFGEFDWPIIARAMIDALASTSGGDELATPAGKANSW
jgi:glycosyltransferase involved in cell wall biosynthesis